MNRTLQYNIYKGTGGKWGAVQFSFQRPHYYKGKEKDYTGNVALNANGYPSEGWSEREGAVFVQACTATGDNVYNWEEKVIFALSVTDMGKILQTLNQEGKQIDFKLMHDPGAKSAHQGETQKHLTLYTKTSGLCENGGLLTLREKTKTATREHKVPLTADEAVVLKQLLTTAISAALNWD